MNYNQIETRLNQSGFIARGGIAIESLSQTERCQEMTGRRSMIIAGNLGGDFWHRFSASDQSHQSDNPLDHWTRLELNRVAQELNAVVLFPFDGPPFFPFQQWAMKAEPVKPSPLGLLIHPRFGLWHAYRGVLLFDELVADLSEATASVPCADCPDRFCLSACPVHAYSDNGYAVSTCVNHLNSVNGTACMQQGCAARLACPVGAEYRYSKNQRQFHMLAFKDNISQLVRKETVS